MRNKLFVHNVCSLKVLSRQLVSQMSTSSITLNASKITPKLPKLSMIDNVRGYFRYRKSRSVEEREGRDISILDTFSVITKSLENQVACVGRPSSVSNTSESFHPLWVLSSDIKTIASRSHPKNILTDLKTALSNIMKTTTLILSRQLLTDPLFSNEFKSLLLLHADDVGDSINGWINNAQDSCQLLLRVHLLQEYLLRLQKSIESGDIPGVSMTLFTEEKVIRICDCFLLGTSSERLSEHLSLYGPNISQFQLQECFYLLFESELKCSQHLFTLLSDSHQSLYKGEPKLPKVTTYDIRPPVESWKQLNRRFVKFTSGYSYLLDSLEVNSKARCVFAWTDPSHSGFKALPDDHVFPLESILLSRQQYFKEAESVSTYAVRSFTGATRLMYGEQKENRSNFRYGIIFLFGTICLDWLICEI